MIVSNSLNGSKHNILTQIIEMTQDAVIVTNHAKRIVIFNGGACKMFGYTIEEIIDGPLNLLFPEHLHTRHDTHLKDFNEEHQDKYRESYTDRMGRLMNAPGNAWDMCGVRKDGELFEIEATISKVVDHGNCFFAAIVRDVSKRCNDIKKLQNRQLELEEYRKQKKRVLLDQLADIKWKK